MEVRKVKCEWCEKTYAVMDSTASDRDAYCSEECEAEYKKACSECNKWMDEIRHAWYKLTEEYEPGEDEDNPCYDSDTPCMSRPHNKRMYLAFKTRYQKWKNNHCWKKSFWAWDEDSGGTFFGGGGCGDSGGAGGLVTLVLKGIGILVAVWIGWAVIKGVWDGIFGSGGSEEITEAAIMEKWQEHLEKRRDAFDDGLPEKEIEAKGLKNYTWDEWQEKFKKEHDAADKSKAEKKEVTDDEEGSVAQKAKEIGDQAMLAAKGLGESAKSLWQDLTSEEAKDPEAGAKAKVAAETMAMAEAESEARTKRDAEVRAKVAAEAKAKAEAEARARAEAEAKRLAEELARKEAEAKVKMEAEMRAKKTAEAKAKTESEARAKAETEAKRLAEEMARKDSEVKARAEAEARAKAKAEADAKPKNNPTAEGVVSGQNKGTGHKASKESKGIRIVVQGKGRTKDAAVRSALRQAVWRTVGTWVDSKERIAENREKVIALVETVTEADVREFEVTDTQEQNGGFIVKVRVSVSKKKIAPKFAEIFPDVFGN